MTTVQIALPDEVFSPMHMSPGRMADEMRVAASTIWYAKGLISQGQGAEIAGMTRTGQPSGLWHLRVRHRRSYFVHGTAHATALADADTGASGEVGVDVTF